jgi:hypothetical protein
LPSGVTAMPVGSLPTVIAGDFTELLAVSITETDFDSRLVT